MNYTRVKQAVAIKVALAGVDYSRICASPKNEEIYVDCGYFYTPSEDAQHKQYTEISAALGWVDVEQENHFNQWPKSSFFRYAIRLTEDEALQMVWDADKIIQENGWTRAQVRDLITNHFV